ncbi:MAG: hypothetical protein KY468_08165 [Armatimonadetes bacterium]|nr:hypothetical protein [Armatimonadota bacterium]
MKLTPAQKKQITKDWQSRFPGFAVYKTMWLLRRAGPLVIGVNLNPGFGNFDYLPLFHVHNLARPWDTISLNLRQELLTDRGAPMAYIPSQKHEEKWEDAVRRMYEQAPLPLEGDVPLSQVVQAYKNYILKPVALGASRLYEDVISLLCWCGYLDEAKEFLEETCREIIHWPQYIWDKKSEGIEGWRDRMLKVIEDPERVKTTVQERITRHKLEKIPASELICDL